MVYSPECRSKDRLHSKGHWNEGNLGEYVLEALGEAGEDRARQREIFMALADAAGFAIGAAANGDHAGKKALLDEATKIIASAADTKTRMFGLMQVSPKGGGKACSDS